MNFHPHVLIGDFDDHTYSCVQIVCRQIKTFKKIDISFKSDSDSISHLLKNKKTHLLILDVDLFHQVKKNIKDFNKPVILLGNLSQSQKLKDDFSFIYDCLEKPVSIKKIQSSIQEALKNTKIQEKKEPSLKIIGQSQAIKDVLYQAQQVSEHNTNIFLTGESGTGKELIAQWIHQNSQRSEAAFIAVNCGAIPHHLSESIFFGHKKGSFTGAVSDQVGLLEAAHKGTLFLDEIGELPLHLQPKLLRVIQEGLFRPVGSLDEIKIDVRFISATHRQIEKMIEKKEFREDLFHRLNVIQIHLPSLKDRKEDIVPLSLYFLKKHLKKHGKDLEFSKEALQSLTRYHYPGNIRELENLIERSTLLAASSVIQEKDLFSNSDLNSKEMADILNFEIPPQGLDLDQTLRQVEEKIVTKSLDLFKGKRNKVAQFLKITPRSLKHRIHKYKKTS